MTRWGIDINKDLQDQPSWFRFVFGWVVLFCLLLWGIGIVHFLINGPQWFGLVLLAAFGSLFLMEHKP